MKKEPTVETSTPGPSSTSSVGDNSVSRPIMTLYELILDCAEDSLTEALVSSIIDGCTLPVSMKDLTEIQQNKTLKENVTEYRESIENLCRNSGLTRFKSLLATSATEKLDHGLINTIREKLCLKFTKSPLVEGKVVDGKILYRTVSPWDGQRLSTGHRSKNSFNFDYDSKTCFRMTPAQFNEVKSAGNRTGSFSITSDQFRDCFNTPKDKEFAVKIWAELRKSGIIDGHYRLSTNFKNFSKRFIHLESNVTSYLSDHMNYSDIGEALTQLSKKGTRKDRSPVLWDKSQIFGFAPCTEETKTLAWDVGTLAELKHFQNPNDQFTFFHLPSEDRLEDTKYSNENTINETSDRWMALAVPSDRVEKTTTDSPLSAIDLLSKSTTPKEAGAIRRLFRESVKKHPPALNSTPAGNATSNFWRGTPKERSEVDRQLTETFNSFSSK